MYNNPNTIMQQISTTLQLMNIMNPLLKAFNSFSLSYETMEPKMYNTILLYVLLPVNIFACASSIINTIYFWMIIF
jgi:hypothetical protein